MARTDSRGGPETRDRIALAASRLFAERGFEGVTVAEVGRAAGVSSVTVFKYFPKKEDLFFDRSVEITQLLLAAVADQASPTGVGEALRGLLLRLVDERHPVSAVEERSVTFFRTVAQSPTLIARARQIAADMQAALTLELEAASFDGDAALTAAFFIAGYARILTETATDLINGESHDQLTKRHRARIERLLRALSDGVIPAAGSQAPA
jgi:AcrR family transcriptional regulator